MNKKVAVIGAGITGITTAYYLVKQGFKVVVYDEEAYPAMKTSFANGGQVSVSNSEVWNTWSNVQKGIKWVFKKDAPLLIRPQLDLAQWNWMVKFLINTIQDTYKENTKKTIALGLRSRKLYDEICAEENIQFDRLDCGILHFYKDEKYFNAAKEAKNIYNQNGVEWDILNPTEIINLDSSLKNIPNILGGAYTATDWTGDIHKFCYELKTILEKKYNVLFCFSSKISSLQNMTNDYDAVVISAGVGSVKLAKQIGDSIDIYPVKGYSITINNVPTELLPKVSLLDDQAKIVTATLGNKLRVAGTAELTGENYDIRRDRIEPLLKWVHNNFPQINTHEYSSWACLRPMTSNMLPIVNQSTTNPKVFYNTGHGHLGWTLSPATAKDITERIM